MPRYYFDIHDGGFTRDEEGGEFADFEAARREAMNALPEIARWLIPEGGDNQSYTVRVRDEVGVTVYEATLTFRGRRPEHPVVRNTTALFERTCRQLEILRSEISRSSALVAQSRALLRGGSSNTAGMGRSGGEHPGPASRGRA